MSGYLHWDPRTIQAVEVKGSKILFFPHYSGARVFDDRGQAHWTVSAGNGGLARGVNEVFFDKSYVCAAGLSMV